MPEDIKQISRVLGRVGEKKEYVIFCEACGHGHILDERWTFNGNFESPTFSPSLLVRKENILDNDSVCHSFITDGKIQYLNDCTHELAGKTVELCDFNKW